MDTAKDDKNVPENSITSTSGKVYFALDVGTGTPSSLSGDVSPRQNPLPSRRP